MRTLEEIRKEPVTVALILINVLIFIAVVLPVDLIDKAAQQDDGPDEMQPEHQNNK